MRLAITSKGRKGRHFELNGSLLQYWPSIPCSTRKILCTGQGGGVGDVLDHFDGHGADLCRNRHERVGNVENAHFFINIEQMWIDQECGSA